MRDSLFEERTLFAVSDNASALCNGGGFFIRFCGKFLFGSHALSLADYINSNRLSWPAAALRNVHMIAQGVQRSRIGQGNAIMMPRGCARGSFFSLFINAQEAPANTASLNKFKNEQRGEERNSLIHMPEFLWVSQEVICKALSDIVQFGLLVVSLRNLVVPSFHCFPPRQTDETAPLRRVT